MVFFFLSNSISNRDSNRCAMEGVANLFQLRSKDQEHIFKLSLLF